MTTPRSSRIPLGFFWCVLTIGAARKDCAGIAGGVSTRCCGWVTALGAGLTGCAAGAGAGAAAAALRPLRPFWESRDLRLSVVIGRPLRFPIDSNVTTPSSSASGRTGSGGSGRGIGAGPGVGSD